ncbi:amino acid ABC transporter substrate-binding protein [Microbacterium lushaniae]|nr:amino acid ABC transporter substrate-binding protein [Microbacterium lushaniae]KAA9150597.1 amino acid ABC transporter substrate-binding protein [Microbacterium lushaniae]
MVTAAGRRALAGITLITATGMLALAGCAATPAPAASGGDCEVRSLLVGAMTGLNAEHGIGTKLGAESAVRTVNDNGGINGCTLVLDIVDDGGDSTQTLAKTQTAMQQQDYVHVNVTGYGGASVQPYLIAQKQFAITNLGIPGVLDPGTATFQFDTINLVSDSASVVVEQAIDDGAQKVGIVVDNTATGQSLVDILKKTAADAGAEIATVESVDLAAVDLAPAVQRLKAAGTDAVFTDLYGASLGYIIRDIKAAGWDVPIYGGQISYVTDLEPLLPVADWEGIVMGGSAGVTAPSSTAAQAVIDDVVAGGDKEIAKHLAGVLWGSDSIALFAWAANETRSTDPEKLSAFLEENGSADAPGLTMAANTGYSSSNHDWKGTDSIALVAASPMDDVGRFPTRVGLFTPKQ